MEKSGKKKITSDIKYKNNDKSKPIDEIETSCCFCIATNKTQKKTLIAGFFTNLGIFALLFTYTLLGGFLFLAIEGNPPRIHQRTLATTSYQASHNQKPLTISKLNRTISQVTAELRSQTVESIWEITVSLNILYKENWTRLAAQEISRFQEELVSKVASDFSAQYVGEARVLESTQALYSDDYDWNFPKAFLYSLTVLTTIGYGTVTPKTSAGKAATIAYAVIGIPLALLYLSVVGGLLSRVVRGIFSRAFCCCLCSYRQCCISDTSKKQKQKNTSEEEYRNHTSTLQEPFYVRSPSGTIISASQAQNFSSNAKDKTAGHGFLRECDSLSCTDTDSRVSLKGLTVLAPIGLCLCAIFAFIFFGAFVLYQLEGWSPIDGIYFCFMSLSTIGFGNLAPGATYHNEISNTTIWFCSAYILAGLSLTAMCFNILHDEIVFRLNYHDKVNAKLNAANMITPEFLRRS